LHLFFTYIYRALKKRRIIFFPFLLLSVGFAVFFGSQIKLEEDITSIIPNDEKVAKANEILKNSKFLDRIVITISAADSTRTALPGDMTIFADSLADALSKTDTSLLREVVARMQDDMMAGLYQEIYERLPLYLLESDYTRLPDLIRPEQVDTAMERGYKTLLSPASMMLGKNVLRDPLGIAPLALRRMQSLQIDDNFELEEGYIFTKDRKHLLLFLIPTEKPSETGKNEQLITILDSVIAHHSNVFKGQYHAEYFGGTAVAVANATQIKSDVRLTISITLIALFLFISLFFRRITVFFVIFIPVAFGAAFSLALLYLFKGSVSGLALGAGSIILGIAMDYTIHFYTHFKHTNSTEETVRDLSFPLTLGSTTTIGALLSLTFVESEALNDFGMFAAFSLLGAALFTLILFPHLLRKRRKIDKEAIHRESIIDRLAAYQFENNKPLIVIIVLFSIVSLFTMQKVEFESDMMKMNYMPEHLEKAEKNLNNISTVSLKDIYVVSYGKSLDEALENQESILPLLDSLQEQQAIKKYSGISSMLISKKEQQQRAERWNRFWSGGKKDSVYNLVQSRAAAYKFREQAFSPFYNLLNDSIAIAPAQLNSSQEQLLGNFISSAGESVTITSIVKVDAANEDRIFELLSKRKSEELEVFNKKFLTNSFVAIIKNNFNLILGISSLLVLFMLIISYGRIELALISYIPMVLSWVCILGFMGIFGIKFNLINIIVSTFIFGLGDDYCIFITDALLSEYKTGKKNLASYKTGIFISAITTLIGVGVLVFASHPALKSIGLITIIGMLSVLLISNTVLPALFRFFISGRRKHNRVPFTLLSLLQSVFAFSWFAAGCFTLIPLGFITVYLLPLPKKKRLGIFHQLRSWFNKSMIHVNVHVKKYYYNELHEQFEKPAVVIANHHSVIDALLMQSLNPRLILMVNDWVWNSPFMGPIVRLGGFVPKSAGYDENLVKIRELFEKGYSLVIFPEGSRSTTPKIERFHKGAFYIAERTGADIVPVIIHGTAFVQGKDDSFLLKPGRVTVKYLPRIPASDTSFGSNYTERTKTISRYFKAEYQKMRDEIETVDYYMNRLSKNYIYKGPVLEWYMRIKVKLEDNYRLFESLLPKKGVITDVGCGYGFLPYMLSFTSEDRIVIGTDYDEEKIAVANHNFSKNERMSFFTADATTADLPASDAFVLSDILHYLPKEKQEQVILRCIASLKTGGMILIRDADSSLKSRHWGTRYTEFFSTNFGFNKTSNKLEFVSADFIINIAKAQNMDIQKIDNTKLTSNIIYILKKKVDGGL
jgi:1-acyl-sn-glycerol-3-phosphate acyltransferase